MNSTPTHSGISLAQKRCAGRLASIWKICHRPGDLAQEGRDDKLRDALATHAPGDEEVADVEFGAVDVGFFIHRDEAGEFAIDADQKGTGGRMAPVSVIWLEGKEAMLGELQRQPFAEVVQVELHQVFDDLQFVTLGGVEFDAGHVLGP